MSSTGDNRELLRQLAAEQCAPPPPPWRNPVRDYAAEIGDRRRQHRQRSRRGTRGQAGDKPERSP